ncbi:hypothetical protein ElyMa_004255500 [Elysia marginata]|uniref:Uncharacterized protein n=1 Tax=Elysia marginata TaxID=1093978 RepID=A0AAV4GT68_9GAST|nr:hypothetical protein ElyMa_004255500 [Elysia marginata]
MIKPVEKEETNKQSTRGHRNRWWQTKYMTPSQTDRKAAQAETEAETGRLTSRPIADRGQAGKESCRKLTRSSYAVETGVAIHRQFRGTGKELRIQAD